MAHSDKGYGSEGTKYTTCAFSQTHRTRPSTRPSFLVDSITLNRLAPPSSLAAPVAATPYGFLP